MLYSRAKTRAREDLQRTFVARFSFGPRALVDEAALAAAEARLSARFPDAYRSFMKTHGGALTPGLLDLVVERKIDPPDLHRLESPAVMADATETYWRGGMPGHLVVFGTDSMANAFCFERAAGARDDAPVLFFDHDCATVEELAPSFDALLERFLR